MTNHPDWNLPPEERYRCEDCRRTYAEYPRWKEFPLHHIIWDQDTDSIHPSPTCPICRQKLTEDLT